MKSKIVILDDSVILYQHYIGDEKWESVMGFPRGGLTYLIKNNNLKFYAYIDYFYKNCIMTLDLPVYIVDEELGIDAEYSDIQEITEILNRIFPANGDGGDVDLTPYLKKREAEELYQPLGFYIDDVEYDSSGKTIDFYSEGTLIDSIDARPFIKDGMVDSVTLSGETLHIVFNTDAGKEPIDVNLSSIFNPDNYYTKQESDGKYLTEHQPLKTINGQVISGTGNIVIDASGGTIDAYTKTESDERYQPKGNYLKEHQPLKTINNQVISGTGNIVIEASGASVTVDDHLDGNSTNPVQNKVIVGALNGKLDASAYTAPVQSDWNASSGLGQILNKPTIPTVPTNVSAFNNDSGYITSSSTVFNNYYNTTEVDNYITNLQGQITNLIDAYSECCTAMTLSGTAIIYASSNSQLVDIGPAQSIQVFATPAKTIYPAASGNDTFSLGASGNVPCSFKLIEGITTLGQFQQGKWESIFAVKYQFNGGFESIGQDCFNGSTRLKVLDFHSGLTEIRTRAFDGCNALEELIFRSATPPTLIASSNKTALDTLYDTNTSFKIKVPAEYVNAYKTAWSTYASLIESI